MIRAILATLLLFLFPALASAKQVCDSTEYQFEGPDDLGAAVNAQGGQILLRKGDTICPSCTGYWPTGARWRKIPARGKSSSMYIGPCPPPRMVPPWVAYAVQHVPLVNKHGHGHRRLWRR